MLHRLKLDHDGVYFGAEPVEAGDVKDGDVTLDHAPDNAPGRYRWIAAKRCFEPLPKEQQKDAPGAPTLEEAFYILVKAWLLTSGATGMPKPLEAWCTWFEKSVDARKPK